MKMIITIGLICHYVSLVDIILLGMTSHLLGKPTVTSQMTFSDGNWLYEKLTVLYCHGRRTRDLPHTRRNREQGIPSPLFIWQRALVS
jgi:hypothetical protein